MSVPGSSLKKMLDRIGSVPSSRNSVERGMLCRRRQILLGAWCGIYPVRPEQNWGWKPAALTSSNHQNPVPRPRAGQGPADFVAGMGSFQGSEGIRGPPGMPGPAGPPGSPGIQVSVCPLSLTGMCCVHVSTCGHVCGFSWGGSWVRGGQGGGLLSGLSLPRAPARVCR